MPFGPWWKREPSRFDSERVQMEARGFTLDEAVFQQTGTVIFRGKLAVCEEGSLLVELPEGFPSFHPNVYARNVNLPMHQRLDNGSVCVFGFTPNTRWNAGFPATKAIAEAEEVIRHTQANPNAASAPEPVTESFPYTATGTFTILLPGNILAGVTEGAGRFALHLVKSDNRRHLVVSARAGEHTLSIAPGIRACFEPYGTQSNGRFFVSSYAAPRNMREAQEQLTQLGYSAKNRDEFLALVFREPNGMGPNGLSWIFFERKKDNKWYSFRCVPLPAGPTTHRTPELTGLEGKRAIFIGAGSLASATARLLVQAGLRRLAFVDDDLLKADNLIRYDASLREVGLPKVYALKNALLRLAPDCDIETVPLKVGIVSHAQSSGIYEAIRTADVIVEATGLHMVRRYLNGLAYPAGIPLVCGWVTSGTWGGEAVRVMPGRTDCYDCFREFKENAQLEAPSSPSDNQVFPPGCAQPTFTGSGFDSMEMAAQLARLTVQTLLPGGAYPQPPGDYLVWSVREGASAASTTKYFKFKGTACSVCKR